MLNASMDNNGRNKSTQKNIPPKFIGNAKQNEKEVRSANENREEEPPMFILQYRKNQSQLWANKMGIIANAQIHKNKTKHNSSLP